MISIQNFHTFQLQANVKRIREINSLEQLAEYKGSRNGKDFVLLGEGSNCVFLEDFYGDVVIPQFYGWVVVESDDSYSIEVQASESWHSFVEQLVNNGIYGLENLALIPGTVGAAPIQNIGAYGVEIASYIERVEYYDLASGEIKSITNQDCKFGYRDSVFKHQLKETAVILKVFLTLPKKWAAKLSYGELQKLTNPTAKDVFEQVIKIRQAKLPNPIELGNAGSFFKNPIVTIELANKIKIGFPDLPTYAISDNKVKVAAGWLIDQLGLKGYRVNEVGVHKNQALVLVNLNNNGEGKDLLSLVHFIQESVYDKFQISLETEVRCFGNSGEMNINRPKERANG